MKQTILQAAYLIHAGINGGGENMLDVFITKKPGGWFVISCPGCGYRKRFLYYSRRECIKIFRQETGLVYKHLNIMEV
jgi:hypothetical protein